MSRLIKIYAISRLVFDCWIYVKQSLIVFFADRNFVVCFFGAERAKTILPCQ